MECFLLHDPNKARKSTSSLLFNILLEVLDSAIRQEKEFKSTKIKNENAKLFLSTGDMADYLYRKPKKSTKQPLRLIAFSKVSRHKINIHKLL